MSEIRASVVASLKERLVKLNAEVAGNAGNTDAQVASYEKFATLFQGISEGLGFAGAEAEAQPVDAALTHIDSQVAALRAQADLDALLEG